MEKIDEWSTSKVTIVTPPSTPKYSFRITGGSETTIERYPFMAQVFYGARFYCGGSLITTEHVLTAAHCILTRTVKGMSVRRRANPPGVGESPGYRKDRCRQNEVFHRVVGATAGGMCVARLVVHHGRGWGQMRRVAKVWSHRAAISPTHHDNDVAVLRLKRPVMLNNRTRSAPLPPAGWRLPDDAPLTLLGWGVLYLALQSLFRPFLWMARLLI
ncbi:Chymotrypsin-like elastase family member 2A [Eumeta japonica]|uniref:Chymotrypsin-like elastase family member 2A n=1 Tax=Eumeta variegata TaxID=151549 RepID=A0A4C2AA65_EUMVA|nr:Chymotrypsin-like elastase family member 2A [Eumeta japonica]